MYQLRIPLATETKHSRNCIRVSACRREKYHAVIIWKRLPHYRPVLSSLGNYTDDQCIPLTKRPLMQSLDFFLFCFPTRDEVPANWDGVTLMWLHCKVLMWISSSLERYPVRTYPRILRPNRCFTGDMHCRVYLCTLWDANLTKPVLAVNGWIIHRGPYNRIKLGSSPLSSHRTSI